MKTITIGQTTFVRMDEPAVRGQVRVLVTPPPSVVHEDAVRPRPEDVSYHQFLMPLFAWRAIEELAELNGAADRHLQHVRAMEMDLNWSHRVADYLINAMQRLARRVRISG